MKKKNEAGQSLQRLSVEAQKKKWGAGYNEDMRRRALMAGDKNRKVNKIKGK